MEKVKDQEPWWVLHELPRCCCCCCYSLCRCQIAADCGCWDSVGMPLLGTHFSGGTIAVGPATCAGTIAFNILHVHLAC